MFEKLFTTGLIVGGLIIAGLIAWAAVLWSRQMKAWEQRNLRQQGQKAAAQAHLTDSASRLADAMLNHDLNLSEGVIRLKVMLDHLIPEAERAPFQAIYDMEDRVSDFARREARSNLNGMQRMIEDAKREGIEAECRDSVLVAAEAVLQRFGKPAIGQRPH